MLRRLAVLLFVAPSWVLAAPLPQAGEAGSKGPVHPTPSEVRAGLDETCRRLTDGFNSFFGRARARSLDEALARPGLPPLRSLLLRGGLAVELFRLGEIERTIEVLEGMREDLSDPIRAAEPELETSALSLLALARLRLGEERNCIAAHSPASCILPIAPEAVHRQADQARIAGDLFLELLTRFGESVQARWLLNLSRMVSGDYPGGVPEEYRVPAGVLPPADAPGRWPDVSDALGVKVSDLGGGAAMEDLDGDGLLDLLSNTWDPCDGVKAFRNEGDGTFTDVAPELGVTNDRWAKAVAWGDYDNDGDPDLFVSNIGLNRLYRNDGEEGFTDVAAELGVLGPMRSFPSWFFDYDNDGWLDLFVARYQTAVEDISASYLGETIEGGSPVLYRNTGGRFEDVSEAAGLVRPTLPMGSNHGDLDHDGFPDVYLGTGVPNINALMPNVAFRNREGVFEDVTFELGLGHLQKGHGVAFGDLDGDGDQDLFQQMGGAFPFDEYGNVLYENPGSGNRSLVLRFRGTKANRLGLGARIEVKLRRGEERRSVHATVGTGGSFGASSLQQEIGLGDAEAVEELVVRWPGSGSVQRFRDVEPNAAYRVTEGAETLERLPYEKIDLPAPGAPRSHQHPDH